LWFVLSHEKRLLCLLTAPGIPRFAGPSPKEEATRRSVHTHDANGYQATTSDRCFYKYLVYQGSSGRSVSQSTVCCMTHLSSALGVSEASLFTRVRGRGILRSSPSKVATRPTKIRHLAHMLGSSSVLQSDQSLSRTPFESPPPKSSLAFLLSAPRSCAIAILMY